MFPFGRRQNVVLEHECTHGIQTNFLVFIRFGNLLAAIQRVKSINFLLEIFKSFKLTFVFVQQ